MIFPPPYFNPFRKRDGKDVIKKDAKNVKN
jgi:hypothetical protein